jgi:HEAT repeat protein
MYAFLVKKRRPQVTDPLNRSDREQRAEICLEKEERDEYNFDPLDLESPSEEHRRWAIIAISKQPIRGYEDRLLAALCTESSPSIRRHIVRALGNTGTEKSVSALLKILNSTDELIVGDAAESLGKLKATDARPMLERLANSPVDWIANKSRWALRYLRG